MCTSVIPIKETDIKTIFGGKLLTNSVIGGPLVFLTCGPPGGPLDTSYLIDPEIVCIGLGPYRHLTHVDA